MAYRETSRITKRKQTQRASILAAARNRIALGGYQAAQMQALAVDAGIATGTVYRYFPSKAELFAEVFRQAVQTEANAVDQAAHSQGDPAQRLRAVVATFVQRALRAPRLAFALLAEPVDPMVEAERLVFRQSYAHVIEQVVSDGIASGQFAPQQPQVTAAALVGMLNETLVGPLSPQPNTTPSTPTPALNESELIQAIVALAMRAVTGRRTL